ncbi:unnamed protein product [Phyllotreta striolata]|uniref:C2H2-type domain-containing protein n=1 Tax=Phyllotreta striolata TaxID=444603 RepID=A0A9N9TRS6_PHYSR|nr:unnamed protein product [Phyllotreta striolata]
MMPRGRGYSSNHRGYRGGSYRGNSSWSGSSNRGGYSGSSAYNSFSTMETKNPYESKYKYSNSERFSRSDDYHKSYRSNNYNSNVGRERRSPPERKRMRLDAPSSRHESYYGSSRHEPPPPPPPYIERRLSSERHQSTPFARREEFRRPQSPPKRGSLRGKFSPRGQRGLRFAGRPMRRRLVDSSYVVRKRIVPRGSDYARRIKLSGLRSGIAGRKRQPLRPKEEEDEEDEEEDDEEPPMKVERIEKIEEKPVEDDSEKMDEEKRKRKAFIKLHCPHCGMKAVTFRRYEIHLRGRAHLMAMRKIALKQKAIIKQMRQAQRNTQNELEKSSNEDLSSRTNFCPLCKLNYKQKKTVHQLSESHKNMKKFLMPFCKVCNISFKSPMVYENHCCSIDHIKRKQRMENSDGSGEEDNLENFTTIDSVGDVDGEGSEVEEKKDDEKEVPLNVGIEKIRKIEAYYCDICKMYLQRGEESEIPKILGRHCKQRVHVTRYHRMKEAQESEKKMAKKEASETEAAKQEIVEKDKTKDEEEAKDDKLWADVDKDLGDILAEAESGIKSSDEDEDSHVNGERYDRFKLSKNGDEKLMSADEEGILDNKLITEGETKK